MMCQGYTAKDEPCWYRTPPWLVNQTYCNVHSSAPPARKAAWQIRRANQAHQDRVDSEPFE